MKRIKILFSIFLLCVVQSVYAMPFSGINSVIKKMDLKTTSTISISVKNQETGKVLYSREDKKLLNPASNLKLLAFAPILDTLGKDYEFSTSVYKSGSNIYIKLGADPLLTTADLRNLIILLKQKTNTKKINKIFIDDTIIDKVNYPTGWASDDIYPYSPIISPYTLNKNLVSVDIILRDILELPSILQKEPNKLIIINDLKKGEGEFVVKKSEDYDNPNILILTGWVSCDSSIKIPVDNPKYNFIANLNQIFEKEKINYNKPFYFEKTPNNAIFLTKVSHSIKDISEDILWNSDNFSAETAFKVAGGKYAKTKGTTKNAIEMFNSYYKKLGLNTDKIKIFDGSGVSRMNLTSAFWITDALIKADNKNNIKQYAATPNVGTLKSRLRHLNGSLWAKTGTLNGVSSLAGFVVSSKNKNLVFSIIIMNFNKKPSVVKSFEDDLIDKIRKL